MPIRNEAEFIARSVSAVLNQDYPAEKMEIIIADGMSDDATIDLVCWLPGLERLRIISNPRRFQASGLNRAIELACGEIIVRVDGHAIIAKDYVRQCVETLLQTGAQNVGGHIHPVGLSATGKAIAAASVVPFAVPSAFRSGRSAQYTDTVYLGAWRREVFEQVGLFDETFEVNEDYELNYRIRHAGGGIFLAPIICSEYYGQQSFKPLAQQYFRYGCWKPRTIRKHPASARLRHLVAPIFVGFLIAGILLAPIFALARVCWFSILFFYLLMNLSISVAVSLRNAVPVWRLPIVFLIIHLAWGIGFWVGVFALSVSES